MIKSIRDNYRIYGLIIIKIAKKLLILNYELSNATFETPNHAFTLDVWRQQITNLLFFLWLCQCLKLLCGCVDMGKNQQNVLVVDCGNDMTKGESRLRWTKSGMIKVHFCIVFIVIKTFTINTSIKNHSFARTISCPPFLIHY